MGFFRKQTAPIATNTVNRTADLAARVLDSIAEGVILVDAGGIIQFANPAAASLSGYGNPNNIIGLNIHYILRLENSEGAPLPMNENPFFNALVANQSLSTRDFLLVSAGGDQRIAVALACTPTGGKNDYRIVTFRDITSELAKEHEREDFISTASHEMRTPVASIEGYLGLALNPQTATIDQRAKQYLEEAHTASKHLGKLFKDLLDVTKLDDHRLRPRLVPVDAVEIVKQMADACAQTIPPRKLRYTFGTNVPNPVADKKHIEPKVYMSVDLDFLRAILENLIGNAIKYTPDGGEIWVNARGDGDKVLINVTDTGIGISADDLPHLFQKFYRVDNSQTRQIGGTGLGLYLVKERVEAMGGRVWAESAFGDGSTFYVSLPRISDADFQKLSIAQANEKMVQQFASPVKPSVSGATVVLNGAGVNKAVAQTNTNTNTGMVVNKNTGARGVARVMGANESAKVVGANNSDGPSKPGNPSKPSDSIKIDPQTRGGRPKIAGTGGGVGEAADGDLAKALEAAKKALDSLPENKEGELGAQGGQNVQGGQINNSIQPISNPKEDL